MLPWEDLHLSIHENHLPCALYEVHLRVKIFFQISMPIQVIGCKIRHYTIIRSKSSEYVRHETRHLDDDNTTFFSLYENRTNRLGKRNIEIPRKIYCFFDREFFFEYIIREPWGGRLPIRPGHSDERESCWEKLWSKIQLRNHLSRMVNRMGSRDSWRRDYRFKTTEIWDTISIVDHLEGYILESTETRDRSSDFSFSVNTIHVHEYTESEKNSMRSRERTLWIFYTSDA